MRRHPASPLSSLLLPLLLAGCAEDAPYTRAFVAADLSQTIGGPKALARGGDIILENDRIRLAILGPRVSFGPHTSGGSLVDADLQRDDARYLHGNGNDRLAEVFSTVNMNVGRVHDEEGTVAIVSDGSDGGPAIVCVEGPYDPFLTLLGGLWPLVGAPDFRMRTDYILEAGSPAVLMRTVATVGATEGGCEGTLGEDIPAAPASDDALPIIEFAMETGLAFGDFYLQGGSVDVFAADIGFDEEGYVHELSLTGANTFQDPIPTDFVAGTADGVSYGLMPVTGRLFVPMFTSSQTIAVGAGVAGDPKVSGRFPDGTQYRYDRWFTVGEGDVGSVVDHLLEARGTPTGTINGFVVEGGTGVSLTGVYVFAFRPGAELPWSQWTTDIGDDPVLDGSFGGTLPVGDWELQVYGEGRPIGPRLAVTVEQGGQLDLVLESPQPGSVDFTIRDGVGLVVPAKVTFVRVDGQDVRHPALGDEYIGGRPAAVYFAPQGQGHVILPPGQYQAIASRGLEYEIDLSEPFTVGAATHNELDLTVIHSVDSTGFISADFHVHAEASFDSGVSLPGRVATMAAEGIEFFTSTDHDSITDYRPVIEDMGLEEFVSSAPGLEVTTIEIGHFLGFPLLHDYLADNGGAMDWTDLEPEEIVEGIRLLGDPKAEQEPVVFVGHPRDGILGYFDQFGLNHYEADGDDPLVEPSIAVALTNPLISADTFTTDFDALEILNAKRLELIRTPTTPELVAYGKDPDSVSAYDLIERTMEEQQALYDGTYTLGGGGHEGTVDDWFNLLNLGFRYTALGNSDTHGKTSVESGCPRNFVVSEVDDPGVLQVEDIARAVREGRVVASYGPFIRFWADQADQGPGSTVVASGEVTLSIEVQSPSWFDVERVEVYENGALIAEYDVPVPNPDTLNLSEQLAVSPAQDAWYVVIAMGSGDLSPVFTPVDIAPVQLQDVVIDALAGVPGIDSLLEPAWPIPRAYPLHPYALTNPIWIDRDGDGFDPPGIATWLAAPEE